MQARICARHRRTPTVVLVRKATVAAATAGVRSLARLLSLACLVCAAAAPALVSPAGVDHCYSDLGCFPLSAEFYHPRHRPFNVRPLHRRHIRTQFELFNRAHPEGVLLVPWNGANLRASRFNGRLETKIIVPGWLDNVNRALWVRKLKDALLWLWAPVNIIVVRWTNFTPYTLATANTRVVGAELANLMRFLEHELAYDPAYYHVIGHSLGAHIAGYCGDRVHGLGRITALDPARPFFQHMPKSVRLDRGDAKFVDAIHSDFTPENAILLLMSFGMTTPVGHLDFYPNGPPLLQPGCLRDTLLSVRTGIAKGLAANSLPVAVLEAVRYLTACDHQRSHEWFIESITNRECAFVGVRCNEFEGMINGRCTCDDSPSACAIMGIHADQMYLNSVHEELWPVRAGSIDYQRKPWFVGGARHQAQAQRQHQQALRFQQQQQRSRAHSQEQLLMMILAAHAHAHQSPLVGAHLELEQLDGSLAHNYHLLAQSAALATGGAPLAAAPPTRDEIYQQLRQQLEQAHAQAAEPQIAEPPASGEQRPTVYSNAGQQRPPGDSLEAELQAAASERPLASWLSPDGRARRPPAGAAPLVHALDDAAFVEYLRAQLPGDVSAESSTRNNSASHNETRGRRRANESLNLTSDPLGRRASWAPPPPPPPRYEGHPALLSSMRRDLENWYEDNARWHLKTNNRPRYCSNQYQLLIYLGPLRTASGRDRLRANLVVSIVGTRGQLLKQRFVPRGSSLSSFTMQPFFILLEGSYSLGQIKSVALAWEARTEPDPVHATVTFQSSLVQQLGERVPAYKAKQFPWLPEVAEMRHGAASRRIEGAPAPPPPRQCLSRAAAGCRAENSTRRWRRRIDKRTNLDVYRERERRLLSELLRLRQAEQRELLEANQLLVQLTRFQQQQHALESRAPNQTFVMPPTPGLVFASENELQRGEANDNNNNNNISDTDDDEKDDYEEPKDAGDQPQQQRRQLPDDNRQPAGSELASSESFFVPLVDPPDEPSMYVPKAGAGLPTLAHHEGELTLDLHNVPPLLLQQQDTGGDSIVINQVIVSPLQATYGRYGRSAKTFCPPLAANKRVLRRDQTLKLAPTFMARCQHRAYQENANHFERAPFMPVYAS